ncbi:hypothetical protein GCQ56_08205 [Marinifilum sp. N1E240]|uniref:hypothetical protein n=1 Tax=Marinifilum sp. N1E240 TaxID=2608082 RepID=UPI00128DE960|nr:hypothetical protein [Marinifilum sp. N1E240]MPQ46997.1 hypothetical protein [Marinifilum sp. N1E240]
MEEDQNYLRIFQLSVQGKIRLIIPNQKVELSPIITELSNQITRLESRLISNDTDKRITREKLRGRVEGLKAAIFEIKDYLKSKHL